MRTRYLAADRKRLGLALKTRERLTPGMLVNRYWKELAAGGSVTDAAPLIAGRHGHIGVMRVG